MNNFIQIASTGSVCSTSFQYSLNTAQPLQLENCLFVGPAVVSMPVTCDLRCCSGKPLDPWAGAGGDPPARGSN